MKTVDELATANMEDCWHYAGAIDQNGYGYISLLVNGKIGRQYAHRFVYENIVGEIPDGLHLDHLCRVRRCINPEHLEPVTQKVNILRGAGVGAIGARKTHCPRGHEYTPKNTYRFKVASGSIARACKACSKINSRQSYLKKRATLQSQRKELGDKK